MKKRTAWALVAAVAVVAIGAAAVGAVALLLRGTYPGMAWSGESYLDLRLEGEIPEQPPSELGTFLERRPPSLRTLVASLDRAASDPKVKAVVVRVGLLPAVGWARVQELRDALGRFRKSGKPAYAYLEFAGNKEYYLASACSKIYAVPTAILDVSGLAAEAMFFRGTLDKIGVEAQFEEVGKYKNAPNQFTEKGLTPPHREQLEAMLDSLNAQYLGAIAQSRGRTREEAQTLVDRGPYDGREALTAGLVDELIYQDQIEQKVKNATRVTPGRYVRGGFGSFFDMRPKVALIHAVGEIIPGESQRSPLGGEGFAGSETLSGALHDAREDGDVKAIVLRIDSPGGSGTASDVIWREVGLARKKKPVVVSMGDVAASGGYYIAMGSDTIVAEPGTITGSIGVFGGKFSLRGLYEKLGIRKEILTRGRHAAIFDESRPWSEEERQQIRAMMVSFYWDFVDKVAAGRKKTREQVDEVAQGRVWTGTDALRIGLVDRLGGLDAALALAKEKAGIPKDQEVNLVLLPEPKGLLDLLLERQEEGITRALPLDVRTALRWARVLAEGGPIARLPFDLDFR